MYDEILKARREQDAAREAALLDEYKAAVDLLEPDYIGPTWQKTPEGRWYLPEHTLGWHIIGWCSEYLRNPNDSDKPLILTKEQVRFILWWYALDENGDFVYRAGVLQRLKGWG
jgi:hypothetical protein